MNMDKKKIIAIISLIVIIVASIITNIYIYYLIKMRKRNLKLMVLLW